MSAIFHLDTEAYTTTQFSWQAKTKGWTINKHIKWCMSWCSASLCCRGFKVLSAIMALLCVCVCVRDWGERHRLILIIMHACPHAHTHTHTHTHTVDNRQGELGGLVKEVCVESGPRNRVCLLCSVWAESVSCVVFEQSFSCVVFEKSLFLVWWLSTVCLLCGVWAESVFCVVFEQSLSLVWCLSRVCLLCGVWTESVFYVVFEQSLFLMWCLSTVCFNCHLVKEVCVERGPENRVCLLCGVWAQSVSTASRHQQWVMASRRRRCTCVSLLRGLTCSCCPPCTPLVSSDWSATSPAPPATCCTTVTHTHSSRFVSQQSVKSTDLTGLVSPFPGDGTFNIVSPKKYFIHFGHCFAFETVFFHLYKICRE